MKKIILIFVMFLLMIAFYSVSSLALKTYFSNEDLGMVIIDETKITWFEKLFAIYLTPSVPSPGERVEVVLHAYIPYDSQGIKYARAIISKDNYVVWSEVFTSKLPCMGIATGCFEDGYSKATTFYFTPNKEGTYRVEYYINGNSITQLLSESKTFEVKNVVTECPVPYCDSWQNYYATTDGHGMVQQRICYKYSSPPTCTERNYGEMRVTCASGYEPNGLESCIPTCPLISGYSYSDTSCTSSNYQIGFDPCFDTNTAVNCVNNCLQKYPCGTNNVCSAGKCVTKPLQSCSQMGGVLTGTTTCPSLIYCKANWKVASDGNCCLGECQVPPPTECTSGQTKCESKNYFECSANKWVNRGEVVGKCEVVTPPVTPPEEDTIIINNIEPKRTIVNPGDDLYIEFSIKNPTRWAKQNLKVEGGIYTKEFCTENKLMVLFGREYLGRAGAENISTCGGEDFVDAVSIGSLDANGAEKTFLLKPKVPTTISKFATGGSNWKGFGDYCVVVGYYDECGKGYISFKSATVEITGKDVSSDKHFECLGTSLIETDGACPTSSCPTSQEDCKDGGGTSGGDGEITDKGCKIPYKVKTKITIPIIGITIEIPAGTKCSESRTKEQYKTATDKEISLSVCEVDGNCKEKEDYEVDCVNQKEAGIDKSWTKDLVNNIFNKQEPGLCLATKEGEFDFCSLPHFKITDKCQTDVLIEYIVGLFLLMMFISMMGRK